MNYRILKVKNDIELFLKDNIEHQNKHIDYILFNPKTNDTYVLASDGYDEAIEFTPYSKNESGCYIQVPEWDYNFDYYIYNYLTNIHVLKIRTSGISTFPALQKLFYGFL